MSKVMFSLPDPLVFRMRAVIPAGERSHVLVNLLEGEIQAREQALYQKALSLEGCEALRQEMSAWDKELGQDGLSEI